MVVGMLRFEAGTSHAGWVIHEPVDWQELATCGPRGYEADVRVLPLGEDDISERGTCSQLIPHPRAATTTPDDCFHALWEGANGIAAGAEPGFLTANSTARRSSWSTKRAALFAGTACFGFDGRRRQTGLTRPGDGKINRPRTAPGSPAVASRSPTVRRVRRHRP